MARVQDVRQFDAGAYQRTVRRMKSRGENVHELGRKYQEEMGTLHPNVDIHGKIRQSNNAMIPGDQEGTFVLPHGISLPVLSIFDGTGSTAMWVEAFFHTAERQYRLLDGVRTRYNPQLATGVVSDVYNVWQDGLAVVQNSQFESDERSAEQVRLLQPASMGNDTYDEDYELSLFFSTLIEADIWRHYNLKGYLTLALDEIGRGFVDADGVREYLGHTLDMPRMETGEICQLLLKHWHFYILQVPTGGHGGMLPRTTDWWGERIGASRVIQVDDPELLAEVRAALVYVTEAKNPTKTGFTKFLQSGGAEQPMIRADSLDKVWRMIERAGEHFSAQEKLPGFQDIPRPGDIFAHYRHAWPIGHHRESENVTPE
jgi:hypothetical protein